MIQSKCFILMASPRAELLSQTPVSADAGISRRDVLKRAGALALSIPAGVRLTFPTDLIAANTPNPQSPLFIDTTVDVRNIFRDEFHQLNQPDMIQAAETARELGANVFSIPFLYEPSTEVTEKWAEAVEIVEKHDMVVSWSGQADMPKIGRSGLNVKDYTLAYQLRLRSFMLHPTIVSIEKAGHRFTPIDMTEEFVNGQSDLGGLGNADDQEAFEYFIEGVLETLSEVLQTPEYEGVIPYLALSGGNSRSGFAFDEMVTAHARRGLKDPDSTKQLDEDISLIAHLTKQRVGIERFDVGNRDASEEQQASYTSKVLDVVVPWLEAGDIWRVGAPTLVFGDTSLMTDFNTPRAAHEEVRQTFKAINRLNAKQAI
jgi:hypothetical protein